MPPEEFRSAGHDAIDWIAGYLESLGEYPVMAQVSPGDVKASLAPVPPESGVGFDEILADFRDAVIPGITHWNHPAFFAYFSITGSGPGILGELLSAGLNVNAMLWRTSPAATELEEVTIDWVRQLLGLPGGFRGFINDTASTSSMVALAAARERRFPEARDTGLSSSPPGRVYASAEAHSSIDKSVITLGLGRAGTRRIPSTDDFRMRVDLLRQAVEEDLAAGVRPIAVVATLGTTSTTSVDPVGEIAEVCREHGLWLHVDAAYAGAMAMVPEFRHHFLGWEQADSIVFNPHKWLFTPVDCSLLFVKELEDVKAAFSLTPEYLTTPEGDSVTNLMDYGLALGRRFRALKLWFVLRYFGAEGIRQRLRAHCEMAQALARRIDDDPHWERSAPTPFSTVVFRFAPPGPTEAELDRVNLEIMERVNREGTAMISHTRLHGRVALRLAIGNLKTLPEHIEAAWEALQGAATVLHGAT
jgi:aromatic-L-amino-acid decarboxylase